MEVVTWMEREEEDKEPVGQTTADCGIGEKDRLVRRAEDLGDVSGVFLFRSHKRQRDEERASRQNVIVRFEASHNLRHWSERMVAIDFDDSWVAVPWHMIGNSVEDPPKRFVGHRDNYPDDSVAGNDGNLVRQRSKVDWQVICTNAVYFQVDRLWTWRERKKCRQVLPSNRLSAFAWKCVFPSSRRWHIRGESRTP